jgi:hypothetical protein
MIVPSLILFKEGQEKQLIQEYQEIDPRLQFLLEEMARWVTAKGYKFVITDLMSEEQEDKKLKRVSKSHQEGRAADIRVRDWPRQFRIMFEEYFEKRYSHLAAISKQTKKPNLILIHDNGLGGLHTHIQIKPKEK